MDESAANEQFTAGYLLAVANILHTHDEPVIAEDVLRELGATEAVLRKLRLTDFDVKPLRKLFREIRRKDALRRARRALNPENPTNV